MTATAVHWLVESGDTHPDLVRGIPPTGLLSNLERARFAALKTAKRRRDWLLGRWTAKHLLQQVAWQQTGQWPPLNSFTILNDAAGAPLAVWPTSHCSSADAPSDIVHCSLSISHSHGHAFCAVMAGDGAIGADMERIEPRSQAFPEDYFTAEELHHLSLIDYRLRDTLITAIWSAKEAVLKALHLGLSVDTRAISCLIEPVAEPPPAWLPFTIQLSNHPTIQPHRSTPLLTGWWRTLDRFVLTLVTYRDMFALSTPSPPDLRSPVTCKSEHKVNTFWSGKTYGCCLN